MTPEKGGGGAGNRCANSAISLPTAIGRLVIDGLCLILTLLLIWLWIRARQRTPSIQQLLPWYTFGILLALTALYLILGILLTVLGSCFIVGPLSVAGVSVPASVASGIANLLLLGIVLVPLTRRLLQHGRHQTKIATLVNTIGLVLSTILFVPSIVLANMASIYRFTSGLDNSSRALVASLSVKFSLAFYTTYFVAALVGSLVLLYALLGGNQKTGLHPREYKVWVICTIASLLINSCSAIVEMFAFVLPGREISPAAWVAFLAIFNIFFIFAILAVLESAQAIAVPVVDPKNNATYAPDGSEETEPTRRRRFTYTASTEIQMRQYTYGSQNSSWPLNLPHSPKWPFSSPTRPTFRFGHEPTSPVQHAF